MRFACISPASHDGTHPKSMRYENYAFLGHAL
jgi:hypothetical protein